MTTIPVIDFAAGERITLEHVDAFTQTGIIHLKSFLCQDEVALLSDQFQQVIDASIAQTPDQPADMDNESFIQKIRLPGAWSHPLGAPDTEYEITQTLGQPIPKLIDFPMDKVPALRAIAAKPHLLHTIESLMGGPDFILAYDNLTFKLPDGGTRLRYHPDAWSEEAKHPRKPICNCGIYVDDSNEENGIWAIPGSHLWDRKRSAQVAADMSDKRADGRIETDGAIHISAKAGDLVIHHVMTLHGSQPCTNSTRRTTYLWFFHKHAAMDWFHHTKLLLANRKLATCIAERMSYPVSQYETPYHLRCNLSGLDQDDIEENWQHRPVFRNPGLARVVSNYGTDEREDESIDIFEAANL